MSQTEKKKDVGFSFIVW